jgi:DEAD/DEAH box helicase domain-containing protein
VLGQVDPVAADVTVHPGATYLHRGESYLVDELDVEAGEALVLPARPGYYTQPRVTAGVTIKSERRSRALGRGHLHLGTVNVTSQVIGYLRRDEITGDVWDETPLQMREHTLRTDAVWVTLDPRCLEVRLAQHQLAGGAHGAEHVAIGLLPLYAPCDQWDIGGLSAAQHADTGLLTVFVHDGQAGGGGFAERGFEVGEEWLAAALQRLESCACEAGCPACVVSPKCTNVGQRLDKAAAAILLRAICRRG